MLSRPLLRQLLLPEWRHAPGRVMVALIAVALGVALAYSVHLINASALAEFAQAVRSANGQADFELRGDGPASVPEALYTRAALHPDIELASPVIEARAVALNEAPPRTDGADSAGVVASAPRAGATLQLQILGLDALIAPRLAPSLMPLPRAGEDAPGPVATVLSPDAVFLNAAARRALGPVEQLRLSVGGRLDTLRVAGEVALPGAPALVMDIAGAQVRWGQVGALSRVDVRLAPGADRARVIQDLALPAGVRAAAPDERTTRLSNLSRAYRVNLTVLALVALFTGGFLVFSVQSLAVAKRLPQLALLGVLGLDARARSQLVLIESAALGALGGLLGLALGTALAWLALRLLGGDLGSGFFNGLAPRLAWSVPAALVHAGLGVLAAVAGGWLPARLAQDMAPAQSLKGLGTAGGSSRRAPTSPSSTWRARLRDQALQRAPLWLLLAAPLFALLPPVGEIPLPAYAAVACLLFGGIASVPAVVAAVLQHVKPPREPVWLLAVERARDQRHTATVAVAGVVASLALSVALTVMVASFRDSVSAWLNQVLPADVYVRLAGGGEGAVLPPGFVDAARRLPGVRQAQAQRVLPLSLDARQPAIALIARTLDRPAHDLPLAGPLAPADTGPTALPEVFVSEAMVDLYGASPGTTLRLPLPAGLSSDPAHRAPTTLTVRVRGVWRDYARQHGSVVIARDRWQALTGDARVNDLALWLRPEQTETGALVGRLRELARAQLGAAELLDIATPGEIRAVSLRIFDRSFAVTYWLQAVAIGIGLFGIAASFSAQVLARRREFGALQHLGFSRRQVLRLVVVEGLLWTSFGALLGLLLGLAISVILVKVVNPQSFHWSMDMSLPLVRLAALAGAVVLAGGLTAWVAGRAAAGRQMALAVKEDW